MKSLRLLLGALAVVTAVLADHHEHAPSHDDVINKLVDRTNHITSGIHHFESELDARLDPKRIRKAGSLRARIERLEDDSCEDHEHDHQCGGDDPQCIHELLVCDGVTDCRNGEDEKHCTVPMKAGDRFVGDVVYDHCTKRRPDHITLFIESVKTTEYFTPIADVHVHLEIKTESDDDESEVSLPADGVYSFARHRLDVEAPEDDGLGFHAHFDGYDVDHFLGEVIHTSSDEVCAEFVFHRE